MADSEKPVEVDVNTDDLDQFNLLLNGKAVPKAEDEPEKEVPAEDTSATDEDDLDPSEEVDEEETPSDDDEEDASEEEQPVEDEEEDILAKPKPKKAKKKSFQDRIDELTAERRAAERAAETERKLREALEQKLAEAANRPVEQPRAKPAVDADAPTPEDITDTGELKYPLGEFDPAYIADLTKHTFAKQFAEVEAQRERKEQEREQQKQAAELSAKWEDKLKEAEKEIPDLRPTIQTLDTEFKDLDPTYGTFLAQTIMSLPNGPAVMFYLANHADEARTVVAAGPLGATIALGRLDGKVQNALDKKRATPVRKTEAKSPPVTTRGSGSKTKVAPDTDDLDAFEKIFFK